MILGIAAFFPAYLGGASLAQQAEEVIPHAIYLAAWTTSAVLILLGSVRLRLGALLGLGLSVVTFGLFFADAGTAIAGGAHAGGGACGLHLRAGSPAPRIRAGLPDPAGRIARDPVPAGRGLAAPLGRPRGVSSVRS